MTSEAACRSCGALDLELILSLGRTPLANALLDEADLARPEPTYPLDLAFCAACGLAQLELSVPPERLFRDYPYFSSFSDGMVRHAQELAERLVLARGLGGTSLAVEVASNDGYLLQWYRRAGVPVLGIEPACNVARVAIEVRGIPTLTEFFGLDLARRLAAEGRRADVLHANNVLAHVPEPNDFAAGIRELLAPRGLAAIEVPYLGDLMRGREFDTIYHEHLFYFSLHALTSLFRRAGLRIVDVERLALHGGSLLLLAEREEGAPSASARVAALLEEERHAGLDRRDAYRNFARGVDELGEALRALLDRLKREGARIAAYGAAAKGATLLNHFGIGRETIDFVVDRSVHKQGRYMPGARLPIVAPVRLLEDRPDYVLLLAWNFKDEILEQQAEYRSGGGRFIIPVPDVEIV